MDNELIILMAIVGVPIAMYFTTVPYLKIKKMGTVVFKCKESSKVKLGLIIVAAIFFTGLLIWGMVFSYTRTLWASKALGGIEGLPDYVIHIGYISFITLALGRLIIFLLQMLEKDSIREKGVVIGGVGQAWNEIEKYEWRENKLVIKNRVSLFTINWINERGILVSPENKENVESMLTKHTNNHSNEQ